MSGWIGADAPSGHVRDLEDGPEAPDDPADWGPCATCGSVYCACTWVEPAPVAWPVAA